jgi:hypothetical protein
MGGYSSRERAAAMLALHTECKDVSCGRWECLYPSAARSSSAISSLNQVWQSSGYDLPGKAKLILDPAALALFPSGGEFGPIFVDLLLRVATDDERDRFSEFEYRAAIECRELLTLKFKSDRQDTCGGGAVTVLCSTSRRREFSNTER